MNGAQDPVFDRPTFIVSSPRSGSTLLFETLLRAQCVYTIGGESHQLIETIPALHIGARGYSSNRLEASDATHEVAAELRRRFEVSVRDRDGNRPNASRFRMLEKTPKNSLRIPFLMHAFPEARFIYLYREPRQVLASMLEAWISGRFKTYLDLPGWPYPYWALLLTPGWPALARKPLPQIVAAQWQAATRILLEDLRLLPADRWLVVRYDHFVSNPSRQIAHLCNELGYLWDQPFDGALPLARHTLTPPAAEKWRKHAAVIEPLLPHLQETIESAERIANV